MSSSRTLNNNGQQFRERSEVSLIDKVSLYQANVKRQIDGIDSLICVEYRQREVLWRRLQHEGDKERDH